jgi:hypothetical protein
MGRERGNNLGDSTILGAVKPVTRDSSSAHCAWAYWPVWKGGAVLLERAARALDWSVRDATIGDVDVRIDASALGDHELFNDASDFRANVTVETIRRLDSLHISVNGGVGRRLVRGRVEFVPTNGSKRTGGRAGVSLTVVAADAMVASLARDRVIAAIERGRPKQARDAIQGLETGTAMPQDKVTQYLATDVKTPSINRLFPTLSALYLPVAVIVFPEAFDGLLTRKIEIPPGLSNGYEIRWLLVVVVSVVLQVLLIVIGRQSTASARKPAVVVATQRRSLPLERPVTSLGVLAIRSLLTAVVGALLATIGLVTK